MEDLSKTLNSPPSEQWLRSKVRENAFRFTEQEIILTPEQVSILFATTGIDNTTRAIAELIEDTLTRWARLTVLEEMWKVNDPETLENLTKTVTEE